MASQSAALPDASSSSAIDEAGKWLWNFLKQELTPYPGRAWVVGRMTISATIVMVLVMVFRIPGGFQAAIFTLLISRENPTETFLSGLRTMVVYLIGTAYVVLTIVMFVDNPLTHFLWVAGSLFIFFYLLHVIADYGMAAPLGFAVLGAISLWDNNTINVNTRTENTLWLAGGVSMAVVVTIVVEYLFRGVHPATDLTEGIEVRLRTVEGVLRAATEGRPLDRETEKRLALYSTVGTSRLRRLILRSEYSPHFKSQMSGAIALVGRLTDIAASFQLALTQRPGSVDQAARERCLRLADQIAILERNLRLRQLPARMERSSYEEPSSLPFLKEMERTVALIPSAFSGSESIQVFVLAPLDEKGPVRYFVSDAFSNPAHTKFALRGTLAAMVCYIIYTAVDWPGISTSVITCFITALSTVGSSRQKQVLRLSGAFIGGIIFGMGAQIFVLPYLDSIAGFAVLFAIVTAIAAWFQTSSTRLSYLGVQLALAYYLINLQEFTIQTSLGIARDRVVGVMLGLVAMWLFFDLLWVRKAVDEMQVIFARNLETFAEIAEQLIEKDQIKAIIRVRQLRDQLNAGFDAVRAQSDAVLFEFGRDRQRKLQIREDIRRWQPTIRTLLLVQMTMAQYRAERPIKGLPQEVAGAQIAFQQNVARTMRNLANVVSGKPEGPVPDIRESASRVEEETRKHYRDPDKGVDPHASDVIDLTQTLVSTLTSLYEDVRATFAERSEATQNQPEGILPNPSPLGSGS